jgi:hypothetical protein
MYSQKKKTAWKSNIDESLVYHKSSRRHLTPVSKKKATSWEAAKTIQNRFVAEPELDLQSGR